MPTFKVVCYDDGVWDGKNEREVTAETGQAAAKKVCGNHLTLLGKLESLRAEVYLSSEPKFKLKFYTPPESNPPGETRSRPPKFGLGRHRRAPSQPLSGRPVRH